MKSYTAALSLAGFVTSVAAHGYITSPAPREPGSAMQAACGQQMFNQQSSDHYGNVQGSLQVANNQNDYDAAACNVWLCKGTKFDDNKDNVQTFTAGQTVPIKVEIRAPHTGVANVSVVDTTTGSVIGEPLISWDSYASNSATIPADQTSFDITIPSDLGSKCSTAGDCVIQWFWDARSIDQTYESCIDFTVGGSGSGSSPAPSASASAPATTAAPSSTPVASATAAPSSATVVDVPASSTTPVASATPTQGSGDDSEETYTVDTFITWLREQAATSSKVRRASYYPHRPAPIRRHPRAFAM